MLPPGLHLFTWAPPAAGGALPLRSGYLHFFGQREIKVLRYDPAIEDVPAPSEDEEVQVVSKDHLKAIDGELAAFPLYSGDRWRALTSCITASVLQSVVGPGGRVDGLMKVAGQADEDLPPRISTGENGELVVGSKSGDRELAFVQFELKRSWAPGSTGETVTRDSKDKTWLFGDVVGRLGGGEFGDLVS